MKYDVSFSTCPYKMKVSQNNILMNKYIKTINEDVGLGTGGITLYQG